MQIDEISPEKFNAVVAMAMLELDDDEKAYLLAELNEQLRSVETLLNAPLNALPTQGTSVERVGQVLREDVCKPFANSAQIIALAPQSDEGHVLVPVATQGRKVS